MSRILVGTEGGLHEFAPDGTARLLTDRPVSALTRAADGCWGVADGDTVVRIGPAGIEDVARTAGLTAHCVLPVDGRVLVGTAEAHVLDAATGAPLPSFEAIPSRREWYTPWGAPPDVRSMTGCADGAVLVNVHVGGVWRAADPDGEWTEVIAVDDDTHQVLADPTTDAVVAAAAVGVGCSRDGGRTWSWTTAGLHATYCRAGAVAGRAVLVSASTGPSTHQAAVYRRPLTADGAFQRCRDGLPEWFEQNVDTGCLHAAGDRVALGTGGEVYTSADEGRTWTPLAEGLDGVRAVTVLE